MWYLMYGVQIYCREKHSFEFLPNVVHHARVDEFFLVCLMCRSGSASCFVLFIPEEIDPYVAVDTMYPCEKMSSSPSYVAILNWNLKILIFVSLGLNWRPKLFFANYKRFNFAIISHLL